MATGRHLQLRKILLRDWYRIIICISHTWPSHTNITLHYNAFGILSGIILIVLLETNVYLGYTCNFGGHRGFRIKMTPKRNFNVRNGFFVLKLVGLEVLHESLCHIGKNPGIPQIQNGRRTPSWITKKSTLRKIENHRCWNLGTFKHLS